MATTVAYILDNVFAENFTSFASQGWTKKCCLDGRAVSIPKNACVSSNGKESSWTDEFLRFSANGIRSGPAFRLEPIPAHSYPQIWPNGTYCWVNSSNADCFQRGQYCFDYVSETNELMLLNGTCLEAEGSWTKLAVAGLKQFVFYVSLLLALVTLTVYLGLPALRKKVYDKCLICYLISLTLMVVVIYVFMVLEIMGEVYKMVYCNALRMFHVHSVLFWLNVICFHLWRSVRSMNPNERGKLLYYAIYAWGCPLILVAVDIIGYNFGIQFVNELADEWYAPGKMASLIVLFINLCLFLHIAFIIWQQKNRWNGNSDCQRHIQKQQTRMWQILKLFLIMGILEWNFFFACAYKLGVDFDMYQLVTNFLYLCPGYVTFIVFVWCNEKVKSELKKRFTSRRASVAHANKSPEQTVKRPYIVHKMRKKISKQCLLNSAWVYHEPAYETPTVIFPRYESPKNHLLCAEVVNFGENHRW